MKPRRLVSEMSWSNVVAGIGTSLLLDERRTTNKRLRSSLVVRRWSLAWDNKKPQAICYRLGTHHIVTRGSTPVTSWSSEFSGMSYELSPPQTTLTAQNSKLAKRWSLVKTPLHTALPRHCCRLARTVPGSLRLIGRYSSAS